MAVINTTNVIDNSMFLKAKLSKNMVGDNYYLENLQDKRDKEWEYRYNRVGIEEENEKQIVYSAISPIYTPIETVITNVKNDKGEDLGTDWAHLAFRQLTHDNKEGKRYRFSLDFPNMEDMTEEEKYYGTSVWITVNRSPIRAGNSCTVRRCNSALTLVGSPTRSYDNITETHLEPCILDNEMKYMQVYSNDQISVPQSEWYATMQLNYYSNQIKINDRFIFGVVDTINRDNNSVYKVKAVIKSNTTHTFMKNSEDEMESTGLVIIALDKDLINPNDNFDIRVAAQSSIYTTKAVDTTEVVLDDGLYSINFNPMPTSEPKASYYNIRYGKPKTYIFGMYHDGELLTDAVFDFKFTLEGVDKELYPSLISTTIQDNSITIDNIGDEIIQENLSVEVIALASNGLTISKVYNFKLKEVG